MKKKGILLAATALCGISIFVGIRLRPASDPLYKGRRLSDWLDTVHGETGERALHALGTNALPCLLKRIDTRDSFIRRQAVFISNHQSVIPVHVRSAAVIRETGIYGFKILGTRAAPAVPALARLLESKDPGVRLEAGRALAYIGPAAISARPAVIRAMSNSDPETALLWGIYLRNIDGEVQSH